MVGTGRGQTARGKREACHSLAHRKRSIRAEARVGPQPGPGFESRPPLPNSFSRRASTPIQLSVMSTVRLMTANLLARERSAVSLRNNLAAVRPDVLVVQELTEAAAPAIWKEFDYHLLSFRPDGSGVGGGDATTGRTPSGADGHPARDDRHAGTGALAGVRRPRRCYYLRRPHDIEHRPHSIYFSRYPMGREATVAWPGPDVKLLNDTDWLVTIDTSYTSTQYHP